MSDNCGNLIPTMCGGSMTPVFGGEAIGIVCKTVLSCDTEPNEELLPTMCGENALHVPPCIEATEVI